MKLLLVTQYFWPETFSINTLVGLLADQGVKVTVLTGKPNYPDGDIFPGYKAWGTVRETFGKSEIIRLPIAPRGRQSAHRLAVNYLSFILSGLVLGPWLCRGRQFDAVFVYAPSPILQTIPAIMIARLKKAPLILWVQDLWPQSLSATGHVKNKRLLAGVGWIVRQIYRRTDSILVQSRAFVGPVASLTDKPEKIAYFPNLGPSSADAIERTDRAAKFAETMKGYFSVVFAGNLGSAQALDTILDAAKLLQSQPTIRFFLIGSGSMDGWLEDQCREHGLDNVILPGRFGPSDMPTIFAAASALLVTLKPDTAFELTIPSKVQAYLAAGKPIVAALDGEGARVIEESKSGLSSAAGDAPALASSILRLAEMPATERGEMAQRGRAYFEEHFEPNHLVRELLQHIRQTIAKADDRV